MEKCRAGEVFNTDTCKCQCETIQTCSYEQEFDMDACKCKCNKRSHACPNQNFYFDNDRCGCVCERECTAPLELDTDNCKCVCNKKCEPGYKLMPSCECVKLTCSVAEGESECFKAKCDHYPDKFCT